MDPWDVPGLLAGANNAVDAAKKLAALHLHGDLQIVGEENVAEVKLIRSTNEAARFKDYATREESRWMRMGTYLRRHFEDEATLQKTKRNLYRSGGNRAVAIAQAVQCGAMTRILDHVELTFSRAEARRQVDHFLRHAHSCSTFARTGEDPAAIARRVANYLQLQNPPFYVLAGSGHAAETCERAMVALRDAHPMHEVRIQEEQGAYTVLFVARPL